MKKIWIMLMACMCVGVAQAQKCTFEVVSGGDMEHQNTCVAERTDIDIEYPRPNWGQGNNDSKGVMVEAPAGCQFSWSSQMWIVFSEPVFEGDKLTVEFDYKASSAVSVATNCHAEPGQYNSNVPMEMRTVDFTTSWKSFSTTFVVTKEMEGMSGDGMKSICFILGQSVDGVAHTAPVQFYLDNVKVTVETEPNLGSGTCGDNLTWTCDSRFGLKIEGTGAMTDYKQNGAVKTSDAPWFQYKDLIKSIIVGEGVTSTGNYCFTGLDKVTTVSLPENSLKNLKMYTFWGCTSLTKISLPESLTNIGAGAFRLCGLESVGIPSSITILPTQAFHQCSKLSYVNLGKIQSIGSYAFSMCYALENIGLPKTLTSIGDNAFEYITALQSIILPEGVKTIGAEVFRKSSIKTAIFNGCPDKIGRDMFNGCRNLTEVQLPEGLQTIADKMFYDCTSLSDITLPAIVTTIGEQAFAGCQLTDVTCKSTTAASCAENAFTIDATTSKILSTLHLPEDADEAYRNTTPWSLFQNYDEPASTNPAKQDYSIYILNKTFARGETLVVPIMLKNIGEVDDFTATFKLPEGFSFMGIVQNSGFIPDFEVPSNIDRWEKRGSWVSLSMHKRTDNLELVYRASDNPAVFKKGDDLLMVARFSSDTNQDNGDYQGEVNFSFNEGAITGTSKFTFTVKDMLECTRLKGDVNEDGKVSINDVNILIEILKKLK